MPLEWSFCRFYGSPLAIRTKLHPGKFMIPSGALHGEGVQGLEPQSENYAHDKVKRLSFVAANNMGR